MATQRYISTSFWDDEWIHKLDPSEKLLYLYFMTNPLTSIAGIYKLSESRICFDTGFNENTIRHIMSKFELAKKAYRFNEWIIIPNWSKHQKVKERDNIRKGIDKLLLSLPDDVFNYSVSKGYKYIYLNELDRPLQGASEPSNYLELDSDMELDSDSEVPEIQEQSSPSKPKREKKEFIPPTLEEVENYVIEKQLVINPNKFIDWYAKSDWEDNQGKKIKNWKNKLINWDSREREKNPDAMPYSKTLIPKQSTAPAAEVVCCGQKYSHELGFCKVCGKSYNRDGTER